MTYVQQADKIKQSFDEANRQLLRSDGSPVFSPTEHAEQMTKIRAQHIEEVEALQAEIAEDLESAQSKLDHIRYASPFSALPKEALEKLSLLLPILAIEVETATYEQLNGRLNWARSSVRPGGSAGHAGLVAQASAPGR